MNQIYQVLCRNLRNNSRGSATAIIIVGIMAFLVIGIGVGLGFLSATIQSAPNLRGDIRPAASAQVFDVNGKLITVLHAVENRLPVPLDKIPKDLQNAFVALEDNRFYQHGGVDPRAVLRAVWINIAAGGVSEGGSTITQQLAKNAFLTQERTWKRKVQEIIISFQIEKQYTKNEILELYLNQIYFGAGAYGVEAAAQTYFGKSVEKLNLAECAMLAGLPKSPNYYSPFNSIKAAQERQSTVLDQMVKYGYLDQSTADKTKNVQLKLAASSEPVKLDPKAKPDPKQKEKDVEVSASYFIEYITSQLIDKYGADTVYKEGLKIYTSIDMDMQKSAEKAMRELPVMSVDKNGLQQPQGALVAIDTHTGYVKAMVGGRGTDKFNRAVLAERQPGSAFKPFVYLTALDSGKSPASIVDDKPFSAGGYAPMNYDRTFRGPMTLRSALELSRNIPAVRLAQEVGPEKVVRNAQNMGITTLVTSGSHNDITLAMALGGLTRGVTPLDIASAFGVLANQGVRVEPVTILKVLDRNGKVLEQHVPKERMVINEKVAFLLTDMMRGVITRGTGTGANIGKPAAGKTGTTDEHKDAWFVGFTPDISTAVWIGFDSEGTLDGTTGGETPATIWRLFMKEATANTPWKDFPRPRGITSATISTRDGGLVTDPKNKDAITDYFIEGNQPKQPSTALPPTDPNAPPATKTDTPIPGQSGKTTTPTKKPDAPPGGASGTTTTPPAKKPTN
ncbi:MAG TPA: PBP1A family penicillin-binding protein [Negativicutes bacterium]|nr:PBP1A family penicillin-binding protein [Negativicutes bacterium]